MIKRYGKYVVVTSKEDFDNNYIWKEEKHIRRDEGVFHLNDIEKYPIVFKYYDSFDSHFCGDFYPCDKEELLLEIENDLSRLKKVKIFFENLLIK